jgi:hypothetical protein
MIAHRSDLHIPDHPAQEFVHHPKRECGIDRQTMPPRG